LSKFAQLKLNDPFFSETWNNIVLALFLTVFVDLVGFGIVIPLLPFYAERFGAAPHVVTLMVASYTFTQFLFAPVWGRLSDRMGRRPIILITVFGTMVGYVWLALTDSLLMLFLARAFTGAMAANVAVIHAYVADVTPVEHRARGMGRMGAASGLGFVTGPAIGGLLAGADPVNPNFQLPFIIAALLSAAAFLLGLATVRESVTPEARREAARQPRKDRLTRFLEALSRPQLGLLFALMAMTPFVFSGVESTFVMWSERALGWGPEQNGYLYTYMGVVAVTVQGLLVGPLNRHLGERRMILAGALLVAAGVVALPFATGYPGLCVAFGLIVLGVCITNPSINSLISQYAGAGERGSLLGVAQSCSGLARIAGPIWGGVAFVTLGRDWPFFTGAVVMAAMFALALRMRRGVKP
jgi:DHA1 family tetracycline resistance protein-like MFS transporter